MVQELEAQERMQLMKFICSFAWADLEIQPEEREFIKNQVRKLDLDLAEAVQVEQWLKLPPPPEEVDPTTIPMEHRKTFVEAIVGIIESDGVVSAEERDNFALFESLLR